MHDYNPTCTKNVHQKRHLRQTVKLFFNGYLTKAIPNGKVISDSNGFCGWQANSTQMTLIDMIFADFNSLSSRNKLLYLLKYNNLYYKNNKKTLICVNQLNLRHLRAIFPASHKIR